MVRKTASSNYELDVLLLIGDEQRGLEKEAQLTYGFWIKKKGELWIGISCLSLSFFFFFFLLLSSVVLVLLQFLIRRRRRPLDFFLFLFVSVCLQMMSDVIDG